MWSGCITPSLLAMLLLSEAAVLAQARNDDRVLRTQEYKALQTRLCAGWNTWSADSVLAHVHLPDAFAITLGVKTSGYGRHYQRTFFAASEAAQRPEKVRLGPHSDDGSYTELTLEWQSKEKSAAQPTVARFQSAVEQGQQYILVTVQKRNPTRAVHLIAEAGFYWNRPGVVRREGDTLIAESAERGYAIRTTAAEAGDPFIPSNTPYLSMNLDGQFAIYSGDRKSLDQIRSIVESHRAAQLRRLKPEFARSRSFTAMQTVLAWNLTYDPENKRAIAPVSRRWSADFGGFVLFDWDTYLAAFMYSLYNGDLALANAVEITKAITRSGFVPNYHSAYQLKSEDRSQPPVGSLLALEIYKRHPKEWFLREIYDELLRWNRWWPGERGCGGLLCWGSNPMDLGFDDAVGNATAALYESGLDNSPMYDGVPYDPKTHLLPMADVGLTSLYVADCDALASIARILGKDADVRELLARREAYANKLETLWDAKTGIYRNRLIETGEFSPVLSPTNFYPLIARLATQQQAERMINEHYFNPSEFHGEWVIPSVARNVPAFQDQQYWRGRIWGPMNFLVYLGMRNYNLPAARADLADRSARLLERSWQANGAVHENYNAITGAGNDVRTSDGYYHWGALLGVLRLLEDQP